MSKDIIFVVQFSNLTKNKNITKYLFSALRYSFGSQRVEIHALTVCCAMYCINYESFKNYFNDLLTTHKL